jgi:hypothetical protein
MFDFLVLSIKGFLEGIEFLGKQKLRPIGLGIHVCVHDVETTVSQRHGESGRVCGLATSSPSVTAGEDQRFGNVAVVLTPPQRLLQLDERLLWDLGVQVWSWRIATLSFPTATPNLPGVPGASGPRRDGLSFERLPPATPKEGRRHVVVLFLLCDR